MSDILRRKIGLINKEHFHGKIIQKMFTKASARPIFKLGRQPEIANAYKKHFWKQDIKRIIKKPLKRYLNYPVPFYGQDYKKQKAPGTSY